MSRVLDIARAIVLSIEMLAIGVVTALYLTLPSVFTWIGTRLADATDEAKYVCFIPTGVLLFVLRASKELLFPADDDQKVLVRWPDYHLLRDRYHISCAWGVACAVIGVLMWVLRFPMTEGLNVALVMAANIVALINYGCLFSAILKVKEILRAGT